MLEVYQNKHLVLSSRGQDIGVLVKSEAGTYVPLYMPCVHYPKQNALVAAPPQVILSLTLPYWYEKAVFHTQTQTRRKSVTVVNGDDECVEVCWWIERNKKAEPNSVHIKNGFVVWEQNVRACAEGHIMVLWYDCDGEEVIGKAFSFKPETYTRLKAEYESCGRMEIDDSISTLVQDMLRDELETVLIEIERQGWVSRENIHKIVRELTEKKKVP